MIKGKLSQVCNEHFLHETEIKITLLMKGFNNAALVGFGKDTEI